MEIHSYKDLIVWQKSIDLVLEVYTLTNYFPKEEIYGLTSQLRRAAISIPSNIAEGRLRGSKKVYLQFLFNAYGSGAEVETQVHIAKQLEKTRSLDYAKVEGLLDEVMRMLNTVVNKLRNSKANQLES